MKRLKQFLVFATLTILVFACKKEYSVENVLGATATTSQWSFTEGANKFKGPIDTAFVDTLNSVLFLTLEGVSNNGTDNISLQVFAPGLKVGTYLTPQCSFDYQRSGSTIYQNDLTAAGAFTIAITHIDSASISGTFNGKAVDKNGAPVTITDGKFTGKFKTSSTLVTPPVTDSGQVMLWSKAGCGGGTSTMPINVSVSNKSGQITSFTQTEPTSCGAAGSFTVKLPVGTYTWKAKCSTDSIAGSVTVSLNGCTKVLVDFTNPPGDYFPITPGSNWTSMLESGTTSDSTYTLSTGAFKTFGSTSYSIFTYHDYINGFFDSLYYRKGGGLYYEYYTDSVNIFKFDVPTAVEYLFLNDNLAPGVIWKTEKQGTVQTVAVTGRIQGQILAKAVPATVAGITYPDVIKVQLSYMYVYNNIPTEVFRTEEWFARGRGMIKYMEYPSTPFTTPNYILNTTRIQVY